MRDHDEATDQNAAYRRLKLLAAAATSIMVIFGRLFDDG
jgi:hypothetical protein